MVKWILIYWLATGGGLATGTAVFDDEEACRAAVAMVVAQHGSGFCAARSSQ